jgi:KaiC/GvpD/RAD55 family RecA-like ATPase
MQNGYIDEDELDDLIDKVELPVIDKYVHEEDELVKKITHITTTKEYDTSKLIVISPEEVQAQHERNERDNPNPEFTDALKEIVRRNNRKLTKEEYIKACDSYATILAERDEEKRKNYEGKYIINPIKKETYLKLLLENKPVENAFRDSMKEYENVMVDSVINAYEKAKENELKVLEVNPSSKKNNRVNLRYNGKCRIASDEGGKVIIIDNKNDVDLLRMKYRKDWIDKKFPNEINPTAYRNEDDDEFV